MHMSDPETAVRATAAAGKAIVSDMLEGDVGRRVEGQPYAGGGG